MSGVNGRGDQSGIGRSLVALSEASIRGSYVSTSRV